MIKIVKLNKILPITRIEFFHFNQTCLFFKSAIFKQILKIFKYHFKYYFKLLTFITAVDFPKNLNRFKLIYEILSVKYNTRIRLKILTNEITPVFSVEKIYINSTWWEHEIWDMFGILFFKKTNIIRLLTDYGFQGFPLRKDFPLSGFVETKYNIVKNRISYENLELTQNYRIFNYLSPWNNYNGELKYSLIR